MGKQRVALEHGAHGSRFGRRVGEVLSAQKNASAVRQIEARDHPQKRGLPATGRPEQRKKFAGLDRKGDVVDGSEIAEAAGDALDLEQRHRGRGPR